MEGGARRPTDGPPWAWRLIVRVVLWFLRDVLGWRVRARRPDPAPRPDQPLVVVFNHTSNVDAFLIAHALWRGLGHWVQPLVKTELFEVPAFGALVRRTGAIPVARSQDAGRETAYGAAVERLRAGGTVLLAPEGTVTHDGSLLPMRHGAARLALQAGADMLVVTHFGAQRGFSPVVRFAERDVLVTMAMDLVHPWSDDDATSLTGRVAAIMLDRSTELREAYPQADPGARWWPPYSAPASPSSVARDNLERYQASMASAIENARERMAQVAREHEFEERVTEARERARAVAEDLTSRSRERAEALAEQARERAEDLAEQARDRVEEFAAETRDRISSEGEGPSTFDRFRSAWTRPTVGDDDPTERQAVSDPLAEYRRRRNFDVTDEPEGDDAPRDGDGPPLFVVQHHDASSEHWDLRLEVDGVLASWAVPKGPSTDPAEKRLAIRTEDHPRDYGDFEGHIDEDEYGGGNVVVWDIGPYRNDTTDDGEPVPMAEAIEDGHVRVVLDGEKLQGGYALTRTNMRGDPSNWLLVKIDDDAADARRNPTSTEPESVLTGRTVDEVGVEAEQDEEEDGR